MRLDKCSLILVSLGSLMGSALCQVKLAGPSRAAPSHTQAAQSTRIIVVMQWLSKGHPGLCSEAESDAGSKEEKKSLNSEVAILRLAPPSALHPFLGGPRPLLGRTTSTTSLTFESTAWTCDPWFFCRWFFSCSEVPY